MKLKVVPGVPGLFQFKLHREPETESFASGFDLRDRFLLLISNRSFRGSIEIREIIEVKGILHNKSYS